MSTFQQRLKFFEPTRKEEPNKITKNINNNLIKKNSNTNVKKFTNAIEQKIEPPINPVPPPISPLKPKLKPPPPKQPPVIKKPPKIEKFNTLKKVMELQHNLKMLSSIKNKFKENRDKMMDKLKKGCINYYKHKINMKRIFDYSCGKEPEKNYEYNLLLENKAKEQLKDAYKEIGEFLLNLRKSKYSLVNILENCEKDNQEDVSDFIVNFCFEDILNNSFIQENMLIVIYLLIEKCIIKNMPEVDKLNNNEKNDLYKNYFGDNILYHIFLSLTRKTEIRNYLYSILPEQILIVENLRRPLSLQISKIKDYVNEGHENKLKSEHGNRKVTISSSLNFVSKKLLSLISGLIDTSENVNSIKEEKVETNNIKRHNEFNYNDFDAYAKTSDTYNNNNSEDEYDEAMYKFFREKDVTISFLKDNLKEFDDYMNSKVSKEEKNSNRNIVISMKEYLTNIIKEISSVEKGEEKYSIPDNIAKVKKSTKNLSEVFDYIKSNYEKITEIIINLMNIIKSNLHLIPVFIKSLFHSIGVLLDYKYKNSLSIYNKYIIKANFLIGNIIIPALKDPNYNGLISSEIISDISKENLGIISNILQTALSCKLFSKDTEPNLVVYNKFIIDLFPIIFEIVQAMEKDFNFPLSIKHCVDTIKDIDNPKRDFNVSVDEEQDAFNYQSICYSYSNIINILKGTKKYYNILKETGELDKLEYIFNPKNKQNNQNEVNNETGQNYQIKLENIIQYSNLFENLIIKNTIPNKEKKDFIYIIKLDILKSIQDKIESISNDTFANFTIPIKEKMKEEEVVRFKKCFLEVLTYVSTIDIQYFQNIIYGKIENYIHDKNSINHLLKNRLKKRYDYLLQNKPLVIKYNIDKTIKDYLNPEFNKEILQNIVSNLKEEVGLYTSDDYYSKNLRLSYCCSYVQTHVDLLPKEYKENNYQKLIMELINDTKEINENIHSLINSVLIQLNLKIKQSDKSFLIIFNTFQKIKNMEKLKCVEYLYTKVMAPSRFQITVNRANKCLVTDIKFDENSPEMEIKILRQAIPDYRSFENIVDNILELEEKTRFADELNSYFKKLKGYIRKEKVVKKYPPEEIENICCELVNYCMIDLYDKLYPLNRIKDDIKFYKKCCRLEFIKPENVLKDKNILNENMLEASKKYINEVDNKCTPADKIKCMAKAFSILQNSITFCSGKNELGVDDTLKPLIYLVIKAKPKRIFSNFNYAELFLDPDLSKKEYGILLTQICMIMKIIKDMKYTELINVSEEEFGKDEDDDIIEQTESKDIIKDNNKG